MGASSHPGQQARQLSAQPLGGAEDNPVGRESALLNLGIVLGPILVGLTLATCAANAAFNPVALPCFTLAVYALGLVLFLLAKISLLRRGISISFGLRQMPPWHRRAYVTGYALMGLGLLSTWAILFVQDA